MRFVGLSFVLLALARGEEGAAETRELGKKRFGGFFPIVRPIFKSPTTPLQLTKHVPIQAGVVREPIYVAPPPNKKGGAHVWNRFLGKKRVGGWFRPFIPAPVWGPPPVPVFPIPQPSKAHRPLAPVIKQVNVVVPHTKKVAPAPPVKIQHPVPTKGAHRVLGKKRAVGFFPVTKVIPVVPIMPRPMALGIPTQSKKGGIARPSFSLPYAGATPFAGGLLRAPYL